MEILNERKKKIAQDLQTYVTNRAKGSQNQASKQLQGISNGTISNILKGKWDSIADAMWQNIENQVCKKGGWVYVPIRPKKFIEKTINDAAENARVVGMTGIAGGCKSKTVFRMERENVFVVSCNEYYSSRDFLEAICDAMGITVHSNRISKIMKEIIKHLLKLKQPVIVIDEADKLDVKVLFFFISFFNQLEGKCGLVLQATGYLETFIVNGVERGKRGFQEIYSRIGQIFLKVPKINRNDVELICQANGVIETDKITTIYNNCNHDVRVVKNMVHAYLKTAL
jgi:hypothetical protein